MRLANDRASFTPVHSRIRAIGPRDLHLAKGRGQEKAADIEARWDDLASSLAERFPKAAELMIEAREDVLAFRHFPDQHWRKVWSTNLLERVNEEIKRRTRVVGIFPNDTAITRLVGAVLLEQDEHWQLEGRRMFSAESMAAIPSLEDLPTQPSLQEATA